MKLTTMKPTIGTIEFKMCFRTCYDKTANGIIYVREIDFFERDN